MTSSSRNKPTASQPPAGAVGLRARLVWMALALISLTGGLIGLVFFAQDFTQARLWADRISPDGSFERLTPQVFAALSGPARLACAAALVGAAGLWIWRGRALPALENGIDGCGREIACLPGDSLRLIRDLRPTWSEALALALLTGGAILARLR